jgi:hypothetical protein
MIGTVRMGRSGIQRCGLKGSESRETNLAFEGRKICSPKESCRRPRQMLLVHHRRRLLPLPLPRLLFPHPPLVLLPFITN